MGLTLYRNYPNLFYAQLLTLAGHLGIGLDGYIFGTHTLRSWIISSVFLAIGLVGLVGLFKKTSVLVRAAIIVGFGWNVGFLLLSFSFSLNRRVQSNNLPQSLAYLVFILYIIWTVLHILVLRAPDKINE